MRKSSESDWARVDALTDEDIDTSDIPLLDESFFKNAKIRYPESKEKISVRIDKDVLDWFKSQGKGYQSKMNAVLRTYYETVKNLTS